MAPADHRIVSRVLIAGAVVLAVGLAGCGRKGALEPPPTAGVAAAGTTDGVTPPAPAKPNRPFFLDWLL